MPPASFMAKTLYGRATCCVYAQRWLAQIIPLSVGGQCLRDPRALRDPKRQKRRALAARPSLPRRSVSTRPIAMGGDLEGVEYLYATYQVARQSAKHCTGERPAVSTRSGGSPLCALCASVVNKKCAGDTPPSVYILYLYCYPNRGQNEGIFPAFEDTLRFTERSPRTTPFLFSLKNPMSRIG